MLHKTPIQKGLHTRIHMQLHSFYLQIWGCFAKPLYRGGITKPLVALHMEKHFVHLFLSFFLQIWVVALQSSYTEKLHKGPSGFAHTEGALYTRTHTHVCTLQSFSLQIWMECWGSSIKKRFCMEYADLHRKKHVSSPPSRGEGVGVVVMVKYQIKTLVGIV